MIDRSRGCLARVWAALGCSSKMHPGVVASRLAVVESGNRFDELPGFFTVQQAAIPAIHECIYCRRGALFSLPVCGQSCTHAFSIVPLSQGHGRCNSRARCQHDPRRRQSPLAPSSELSRELLREEAVLKLLGHERPNLARQRSTYILLDHVRLGRG